MSEKSVRFGEHLKVNNSTEYITVDDGEMELKSILKNPLKPDPAKQMEGQSHCFTLTVLTVILLSIVMVLLFSILHLMNL